MSPGAPPPTTNETDGPLGPVAYVNQFFPRLTETFVYREVEALERRGVEVVPFALRRSDGRTLSDESRRHVARTTYGIPIRWPRLLAAHAATIARRPVRYLRALAFLMTRRFETLRHRALTVAHFALAIPMAREMARRGVVHVHAHFAIHAATVAMVCSRLLDVPYSFTAHNLLFTQRILLREKIRGATRIAAISEFTRRFLIERDGDPSAGAKIRIVRCGLPAADAAARAPRPPDPAAPPRVLFVAQLAPRKGAPVLVEACARLRERGLPFSCELIGDGPDGSDVRARVAELGLEDAVLLRGAAPQDEVAAALDRADVFALPCVVDADGDVDGIPVALMEAMARGVPVVSTSVSGIPELVEDGATGLLVPPGDPAALADALAALLADADLRARLGAAGRERVRTEFDADRSAAALEEMFRACVREHARGGTP